MTILMLPLHFLDDIGFLLFCTSLNEDSLFLGDIMILRILKIIQFVSRFSSYMKNKIKMCILCCNNFDVLHSRILIIYFK